MKITQINLNGLDLISGDYIFSLTGLWDLDKEVTISDLLGDGAAFGQSKIKPRSLALNGMIRTGDPAKIVALNRVLAPNGLKVCIVTIQGMGDLTFLAEIVNRAQGSRTQAVSAQLMLPDPHLYAMEPQSVQLGAVSNASLVLPAVLPWALGSVTGGQGTLANLGNADAYPVITVVGTCDTITVTNLTTGESVGVNVSLADTDTLVIDCSAGPANTRGIYVNGISRLDLKTTPGWIHCPPGDNLIGFARNSLQVKQHCSVALRARWI